jgi:hypothetical protein
MINHNEDEESSCNSVVAAEEIKQREDRNRLISSLELDNPNSNIEIPEDIYDFDVWTNDDIVDFFDSGCIRPPPKGVDREGHGAFWPCSICKQQKNRDPMGRELWVGARVEAAPAGGRIFLDAVIVKIRIPEASVFEGADDDAIRTVSYDVKFDSGRRENVSKERVRLPAKCKVN